MAIYSRFPTSTSTLPSGAATSANQVLQITQETAINTNLGLISAQLPASLGIKTSAASLSITFASDIAGLPVSQSGTWNITNISGTVSLPTGAATETTLALIDGKIPANLTVTSTRLLVDGSGVTQPISAASLPLPTGAATETTLSSVDGKLPATIGQKAMAASMAVVLASDQSSIPVTVASVPLPTGAATEATLLNLDGKVPANLTVTSTRLLVDGSGVTQPVSAASLPLPTGASTEAKQPALGTAGTASSDVITVQGIASMTALKVDGSAVTQPVSSTQLPAALGQTTMANSMSVTIASNQSTLPVTSGGVAAVTKSRNDYSSVNVTTSAYVQLVASTGSTINSVEIFDSSGQTLVLATGAAASEVDQIYIFPGGNGRVPLTIASGTRISIKAVSATASVGESTINYYA